MNPSSTADKCESHPRDGASGEGRVYYSARAQYSSSDEKLQKTGTVSLNLLRDYFKLAPGKDGDHIVYDLNPLNGPVSNGEATCSPAAASP